MDHSTIKFNDERLKFVFPINASIDNWFEHPTEPDFDKLKIWFMLDHLGAQIKDMSGFQHHGSLFGHPTLHRAPLNLGYLQTSSSFGFPAMSFNTALDVVGNYTGEHIRVPDHADLRFTNFATGFSICFRFSCVDFTQEVSTDGTFNRRFASKLDTANDYWTIIIDNLGGLVVSITNGGILYQRKVSGLSLSPAWYQVMVTYNPAAGATAADRIKIYVGGSEVSSSTSISLIAPPSIEKDLFIGARYAGNGFFRGFIQDFRIYMNKVLTQSEVTNLNNNEITIDDITKGRIFVVQYALVWQSMAVKTHKFNVVGVILPVSATKTHKFHALNPMPTTFKTHRYKNVITKTHKWHTAGPFSAIRTHKFNTIKAIATTTKTHKYHKAIGVATTKTHKYHKVIRIEAALKTHKFSTVTANVLTQVVRFQKNSSGTNGVTQDVSLSFTPKAILVFSDGNTANNTISAHYQWIQGFADGTRNVCTAGASKDNSADSLAGGTIRNDSVFVRLSETSPTTVIQSRASCTFGTNKVTFTWVVNDTAATWITVWAIGGTGILNTKTDVIDIGTTSTGTKDYTGLGFTPVTGKSVLFTLSTGNSNQNTISSSAMLSSGVAISSIKRYVLANGIVNGLTQSQTLRGFQSDRCLSSFDTTTNYVITADFDSWITDGFRLDHTVAPSVSTRKFAYLVINGGTWDLGELTPPTTPTNNIDYSVSVSSKSIRGLHILCKTTGSTDVLSGDAFFGVGATDGTNQSVISSNDEHFQLTTDSYRVNDGTNIIKQLSEDDGVLSQVANINSFGTNSFRLDWTTTWGFTSPRYMWVVVADG
jgi:concanavalin A-like lectin/glucanase superfamily protein